MVKRNIAKWGHIRGSYIPKKVSIREPVGSKYWGVYFDEHTPQLSRRIRYLQKVHEHSVWSLLRSKLPQTNVRDASKFAAAEDWIYSTCLEEE
jgi:hypothetical protein